jgi:hypothetical protein
MTSLPDWLVERAALDEVPPASRARIAAADPKELADRISALREHDAAELASHPAAPALAQIEARVASAKRRRRTRQLGLVGVALAAAVALIVLRPGPHAAEPSAVHDLEDDGIRVKGAARLVAFRQAGDHAERLEADALVHEGDLLQLRYNAGGRHYGVIASLDGAGVVTLHFPASEDAPPEATEVAAKTTTLPHAYALDDAPRFERFFILTSNKPIDVQQSLSALREFAHRDDCADAELDLPSNLHQWSLRLRKPSPTHETP